MNYLIWYGSFIPERDFFEAHPPIYMTRLRYNKYKIFSWTILRSYPELIRRKILNYFLLTSTYSHEYAGEIQIILNRIAHPDSRLVIRYFDLGREIFIGYFEDHQIET